MNKSSDIKIINNLKKLEEKSLKIENNKFIVFSSFRLILDEIADFLRNNIKSDSKLDLVNLAKEIDLPGWLLIDLNNQTIYQDQIATIPCFFNKFEKEIFIGYPEIKKISNNHEEYEIFGYYLTNVFNEYLLIGPGSTYNWIDDKLSYWFQFKRTFEKEFDLEEFNNIINSIFNKFEKILNGGEVIIPLSGGFDSRLILDEMLKREIKIRTYSIGSKNNMDLNIAKEIATQIGIPFYDFSSDRFTLSKYLKTKEFEKFWNYSGGDFVLPHFSECLYSNEFKRFDESSIMTPGHSLDFLAGSHLPNLKNFSRKNEVDIISDYHCIPKNHNKKIFSMVRKYTNNDLNNLSKSELFDYEYRQSRYIVNHIRNFEFIGFKPSIPLFSFKLVYFFMLIRYSDLINRNALLGEYNYFNPTLRKVLFVTSYEKKSKLKSFLKRFYLLKAFVSLIRYFKYSDKDTLFLSLGLKTVFIDIFFKGSNQPLSLLRLIKRKIIKK